MKEDPYGVAYRDAFGDALNSMSSFINFKSTVEVSDLWAEIQRLRDEVCYLKEPQK